MGGMKMFYYYTDQKNYYKWGTNDKGIPEFYHLFNKQWTPLPIIGKRRTDWGWEYDLGKIETTKITLITVNDVYDKISLSFFTPSPSNVFGQTLRSSLTLIDKSLVPFQEKETNESDETISHIPASSNQPTTKLKSYTLNPQQIDMLKAHKTMLEGRWFERRIHDYLFFCQGRTKTEKIREITKLLHGEACDPDVVEQGRTGKILKG